MAGRGQGPDFVEALARGLDVLSCFGPSRRELSLSEVSTATGLARPTARRLLLTLAELGYVRTTASGGFALTPRVLRLGVAYASSLGLWDMARPHMEDLVSTTHESSSVSQLDGSDIVYVARVSVPKIITLRVDIGTLFPASLTSQGKAILAALDPDDRAAALEQPSRSGLAVRPVDRAALEEDLARTRERGWALADEELAPGIRSVAVPLYDADGRVRAAMNVSTHAAETGLEQLTEEYLPLLRRAAERTTGDWAAWHARSSTEVG